MIAMHNHSGTFPTMALSLVYNHDIINGDLS